MSLSTYFMEATYLIASILFVLALKGMSHPENRAPRHVSG